MQASKKLLVRLCLSFAMVGVFMLAAMVASQSTVSAASPKGLNFSSHVTVTQPSGVKPSIGVRPSSVCDATVTGGCDAGISTSLTGALAVGVGTGTATPPSSLNGSGTQSIAFNFPTYVVDTTGTDGWILSATSTGLTVPVPGGTVSDAFVVTGVNSACTPPSTTLAPSCVGVANVTPTSGTLSTSPLAYAAVTAASGGDYGSTTITTSGTVPLGATTIGGSASGTITVTVGPALS